ncbi:unnamed protein product, partial [Prorocentrum cordatum]
MAAKAAVPFHRGARQRSGQSFGLALKLLAAMVLCLILAASPAWNGGSAMLFKGGAKSPGLQGGANQQDPKLAELSVEELESLAKMAEKMGWTEAAGKARAQLAARRAPSAPKPGPEEHLKRIQRERVKHGNRMEKELQRIATLEMQLAAQRDLVRSMACELDQLDKSYEETAKLVASSAKPDTVEHTVPTIHLEDLLAGRIEGFNIELGSVFNVGDEDISAEEMDEIKKRRDTLVSQFHTMAKELFPQAANNAKEAKEAHAAQTARLEQKRRRTAA